MTQERDALTGPASRPTLYRCQTQGKLALFPYRIHREDCGMRLFIGLAVSLAKTAICVISEHGQIVREAQAASEPEALVNWVAELDARLPPSVWKRAPCHNGCSSG